MVQFEREPNHLLVTFQGETFSIQTRHGHKHRALEELLETVQSTVVVCTNLASPYLGATYTAPFDCQSLGQSVAGSFCVWFRFEAEAGRLHSCVQGREGSHDSWGMLEPLECLTQCAGVVKLVNQ